MTTLTPTRPERCKLGASLEISRVLTGLWQVADIERTGGAINPDTGADALQAYVEAGFTTFDMADHYGSSEIIAGQLLSRHQRDKDRPLAFTKWCPEPGPMTTDVVRAGVQQRLDRLGVDRIDLLQFHWWSYEHPEWLEALHELTKLRDEGLIREIGVTNFDAAHLHLALADGIPLLTNQVSFSLLDRRAAGALTKLCSRSSIRLLAYGTLGGGFLSERWLGQPEPDAIGDWSKMKYKRFIDTTGGWAPYQELLKATAEIAQKHGVSIANVAARWVLEQTSVAGIIIGARLNENEHISDNAKLFSFALDAEDQARLDQAFASMQAVPGDCGDEYRKPPFLTASGDLSHHLSAMPKVYDTEDAPHRPGATRMTTGSDWEEIAGYCRAQKIGDRLFVSGTTATSGTSRAVAKMDAGAQTTYILDKIQASLSALGGSAEHVVRTRIFLTDANDVMAVSEAHNRVFATIRPVNTLVVVAELIGDHKVEIEAEAMLA
ncbi:MAG: aldo/keto reductase [Pseudomonadota bacterium]